jgi:alpha-amylase/alpha-mannosidase (GH57 family)
MARRIYHGLVLNLHQPSGNLGDLLSNVATEWQARELLYAYDRIPRALEGQEDVGRVHLSLSGSLLEALADPSFQSRVYGIVKCGDLLWRLRNPAIEVLGTAYYHPVLPLTPCRDRDAHVERWLGLARHLFGRGSFQGFWPPEMGFCMELIPLLRRFNYRYVIVDAEHIEPLQPMPWEEIRYRPHVARFGDSEIVVIPRDRELSAAQESGLECQWFLDELDARTRWCSFPPLVSTATDGDNGGWFRNTNGSANFWGVFYRPLLDKCRRGESNVAPIFIHDYLDRFGAHGEVAVRTGAWNTGFHDGRGFVQWTGSQIQRDGLARVAEVSGLVEAATNEMARSRETSAERWRLLEEARWRLLRAETSCHFFWGEAWVDRCHRSLDDALGWLHRARTAG